MDQRLIALGDSMTLGHWDEAGGWIARVRRIADEHIVRNKRVGYYATVYNLGISSNTSRHVLGRYRGEVDARHDPADKATGLFVVLAVGINDSAVHEGTNQHLVSPDAYQANMRALVSLAKQDTQNRVLVLGLTPIAGRVRVEHREREYRPDLIAAYNDIARQAAQDDEVRFVDLLDGLRPHDGHWLDWDGVHLTAGAHRRIAELIDPELALLGWGPSQPGRRLARPS